MRKKVININADGTLPTLTVRYAQGFALSSVLNKSSLLGAGGGISGLR